MSTPFFVQSENFVVVGFGDGTIFNDNDFFSRVLYVSLHSCLCVCFPLINGLTFECMLAHLMAANDGNIENRSLFAIHCVCVCVSALVFCLSVDNPC